MNVDLVAGNLPQGFCHTTWQATLDAFVAAMSASTATDFRGINFGPNTPAAEDQDKPWVKTDAYGRIIRMYSFSGAWISPHPVPASSDERRIWVGTEANLWAYDGGDGNDPVASPPTETTGAMWQVDTAFAFKFPIGVGANTVDYGGGASTVSAKASTTGAGAAGEEKHTLTWAELSHTHSGRNMDADISGSIAAVVDAVSSLTGNGGTAIVPHTNMPPFYGVYFIKRTARAYYTA